MRGLPSCREPPRDSPLLCVQSSTWIWRELRPRDGGIFLLAFPQPLGRFPPAVPFPRPPLPSVRKVNFAPMPELPPRERHARPVTPKDTVSSPSLLFSITKPPKPSRNSAAPTTLSSARLDQWKLSWLTGWWWPSGGSGASPLWTGSPSPAASRSLPCTPASNPPTAAPMTGPSTNFAVCNRAGLEPRCGHTKLERVSDDGGGRRAAGERGLPLKGGSPEMLGAHPHRLEQRRHLEHAV